MLPHSFPMRRRSFLGLGVACGISLLTSQVKKALAADAPGKAKNVLVIYEQGGLSHIDTWDPKPDAYADQRSPYRPIQTKVPGMQFTELLTKTARVADKLTVVRSMYHKTGAASGHPEGTQYALSGSMPNNPIVMPDIGSLVVHRLGSACKYLPPYIMVPGNHEQAAMTRLGFLPSSDAVFKTNGFLSDPNWNVPNFGLLQSIAPERFSDRRDLLSNLDIGLAANKSRGAEQWQSVFDQATQSLLNPLTKTAFKLADEPEKLREKYGTGHRGQCYLLGRRLIERGVRFVTVDVREPSFAVKGGGGGNLNWDHHDHIYASGTCELPGATGAGAGRYGIATWPMMGSTDQAFAALIEDMHERGLLDETLVCFVTEFGRTPMINKSQGRDHWVAAYSIAFAGAGVPGGQIVGATDRHGGQVLECPYTPEDYAATIYKKLGMDLSQPVYTRDNRPILISTDGRPIREVC
jgi:hypothetical protein